MLRWAAAIKIGLVIGPKIVAIIGAMGTAYKLLAAGQIFTLSLGGPKAWKNLAAGIAVAAVSLYAMDLLFDSSADNANRLADNVNDVSLAFNRAGGAANMAGGAIGGAFGSDVQTRLKQIESERKGALNAALELQRQVQNFSKSPAAILDQRLVDAGVTNAPNVFTLYDELARKRRVATLAEDVKLLNDRLREQTQTLRWQALGWDDVTIARMRLLNRGGDLTAIDAEIARYRKAQVALKKFNNTVKDANDLRRFRQEMELIGIKPMERQLVMLDRHLQDMLRRAKKLGLGEAVMQDIIDKFGVARKEIKKLAKAGGARQGTRFDFFAGLGTQATFLKGLIDPRGRKKDNDPWHNKRPDKEVKVEGMAKNNKLLGDIKKQLKFTVHGAA